MRSLHLHCVDVIRLANPPTDHIDAMILMMDRYPPIRLVSARRIESLKTVGVNAGSYTRVLVETRGPTA